MFLIPNIVAGIESLDEESIDYLEYKISGFTKVYYDAYAVTIVVFDIKLESFAERTINYSGSTDEILNTIKSIYSDIDFNPYAIGFDFIGEDNGLYKNQVN